MTQVVNGCAQLLALLHYQLLTGRWGQQASKQVEISQSPLSISWHGSQTATEHQLKLTAAATSWARRGRYRQTETGRAAAAADSDQPASPCNKRTGREGIFVASSGCLRQRSRETPAPRQGTSNNNSAEQVAIAVRSQGTGLPPQLCH